MLTVQSSLVFRHGAAAQALVLARVERLIRHPRLDLAPANCALDQADWDCFQPLRLPCVDELSSEVHAGGGELRPGGVLAGGRVERGLCCAGSNVVPLELRPRAQRVLSGHPLRCERLEVLLAQTVWVRTKKDRDRPGMQRWSALLLTYVAHAAKHEVAQATVLAAGDLRLECVSAERVICLQRHVLHAPVSQDLARQTGTIQVYLGGERGQTHALAAAEVDVAVRDTLERNRAVRGTAIRRGDRPAPPSGGLRLELGAPLEGTVRWGQRGLGIDAAGRVAAGGVDPGRRGGRHGVGCATAAAHRDLHWRRRGGEPVDSGPLGRAALEDGVVREAGAERDGRARCWQQPGGQRESHRHGHRGEDWHGWLALAGELLARLAATLWSVRGR